MKAFLTQPGSVLQSPNLFCPILQYGFCSVMDPWPLTQGHGHEVSKGFSGQGKERRGSRDDKTWSRHRSPELVVHPKEGSSGQMGRRLSMRKSKTKGGLPGGTGDIPGCPTHTSHGDTRLGTRCDQGCAGSICCSVPAGAIRSGSTHPSECFYFPDDIPGGSSGTCGVRLVWSEGGVTTGE